MPNIKVIHTELSDEALDPAPAQQAFFCCGGGRVACTIGDEEVDAR